MIQEQGVYCIYNHKGVVMYIGLSMNLQRSVETLGGLWWVYQWSWDEKHNASFVDFKL